MDYPVVYAGHGDLVDDGYGNWYVVMLASRPCKKHSSMGRETFLAKVIWENGWPVIAPQVGRLEDFVEIPLEEHRFANEVTSSDCIQFWENELDERLVGIEKRDEEIYSLSERKGMLRLYCRKEKISEKDYSSYLGLRQKSYRFEVETGIEFEPKAENETAGVILYQNHENHLKFEIKQVEGKKVFEVNSYIHGEETKLSIVDISKWQGILKIIIQCHDQEARVWIGKEKNLKPVAEKIPLTAYTTEEAGGFVGCTVGMYASSNGKQSENYADFGWFYLKNMD